jgi:hypothetical protein
VEVEGPLLDHCRVVVMEVIATNPVLRWADPRRSVLLRTAPIFGLHGGDFSRTLLASLPVSYYVLPGNRAGAELNVTTI